MKTTTLAVLSALSFFVGVPALLLGTVALEGCDPPTSDQVQQSQQESILQQGTSAVGMPAIKNFRERRLFKDILEMRDQGDLSTFTYTYSEVTGKFSFLCNSIGFPLPYATQFTNPQKTECNASRCYQLPQADPNGLFSPAAADGTWVMCKDPTKPRVVPTYVEPKVSTFLYELPGVKAQ
jgi:hypothetical protein